MKDEDRHKRLVSQVAKTVLVCGAVWCGVVLSMWCGVVDVVRCGVVLLM